MGPLNTLSNAHTKSWHRFKVPTPFFGDARILKAPGPAAPPLYNFFFEANMVHVVFIFVISFLQGRVVPLDTGATL